MAIPTNESGGGSARDRLEGSFLGALPADVQEVLTRESRPVTYPRGSTIRDRGSAGRPGVVVEGLIRAYVAAADGREATVTYARPGDAIGIAAPFIQDLSLGLQALEETTVLYFDLLHYEHALATDVALARTVAEHLARGMARSSDAARTLAFGRVSQRVAGQLICLATPDDHGRLTADVTQQGLAEAVGSVRDVVARTLAQLSSKGLVVTSHGRVVSTDEDGLRHEAAML